MIGGGVYSRLAKNSSTAARVAKRSKPLKAAGSMLGGGSGPLHGPAMYRGPKPRTGPAHAYKQTSPSRWRSPTVGDTSPFVPGAPRAPSQYKQWRKGGGVNGIDNKYANAVVNSRPSKFIGRHPYAVGGGIIGATAMSNAMGPRAPKGSADQARGIYGF